MIYVLYLVSHHINRLMAFLFHPSSFPIWPTEFVVGGTLSNFIRINYCVHSFVFHIHSRSLTYSHSSFIPSELFIVCLPPSNYSPISLSFLRNFNLKIASGFCLLRFGLFSCLFWWISILPFPLFHSIYCCSKFEYSMSRSVLLPLLKGLNEIRNWEIVSRSIEVELRSSNSNYSELVQRVFSCF